MDTERITVANLIYRAQFSAPDSRHIPPLTALPKWKQNIYLKQADAVIAYFRHPSNNKA